jgi:16S rRNA (guanine527-N7)-methyltransferase
MENAEPVGQQLVEILVAAQTLGFVGPGSLKPHLEHSWAFASALSRCRSNPIGVGDLVVDLGAGGGIPSLVLATRLPDARYLLIEASAKRAEFLQRAVEALGLGPSVVVVKNRAEEVGHSSYRGLCSVVVARSFGRPAVVAECAAGLLEVGGHLVVSEPPEAELTRRWPVEGLDKLGLGLASAVNEVGAHFVVLTQLRECPNSVPRRIGVPDKRPLF